MMVLADENIDRNIIKFLRDNGIPAISVYENHRGVTDEEIISISKNPSKIILTEDKDFGEWVFSHNQKDISVILLRYHFSETQKIKQILLEIIKSKFNLLQDSFTTITPNKIRIRPYD